MKSGTEYAKGALTRAAALQKHSTTLKRTAGSIRAEISAKQMHGLTDKELKILEDASMLLNRLANSMAQGAEQKKIEEDNFDRRVKLARATIASTFGRLKTPREVIPMLAMSASSYSLKETEAESVLRNMPDATEEALASMAYRAARMEGDLDAILTQAWDKFLAHRLTLEKRHGALISKLESAV